MKNQLLLLGFILLIGFACQTKEPELQATPLSEQNLEFEIYDSLVVDYLGNVTLMDISPDGKSYLLIDQNTDSIFVTNSLGKIIHTYKRFGEGPENYPTSRIGMAKFLDENNYLIPTMTALFQYDLEGNLIRQLKPDYTGRVTTLMPYLQVHFVKNGKVYLHLPGRYGDLGEQGLEYQANARQLEVIDLQTGKFNSAVPFPSYSKYSSDTREFGAGDFLPILSVHEDSLYLIFKNEPKIFTYNLSNLEIPASVKQIPFTEFIESKEDQSQENGSFNLRNFFVGNIYSVFAIEGGEFLISYLQGLSDEAANQVISEGGSDFQKIFKEAGKINSGGMVLFNGNVLSPVIEKSEMLGSLNLFVSKDEIWFSLNFSEAENDYSVIYKTRLVQK